MQFISLLGMITLLLIAWLLSYHKKKIKFRTIIWGLSLQFLFAIIILRKDYWSFVGMTVLALLFILYVFREKTITSQKVAGFSINNLIIISNGNFNLFYSKLDFLFYITCFYDLINDNKW